MHKSRLVLWIPAAMIAVASSFAGAQQAALTAADYARAEKFLRESVIPLVSGVVMQPVWLSGERIGYRSPVRGGGSQFVLVDPAKHTRVVCSPATDRCGGPLDPREISRITPQRGGSRPESISPDGKKAAFIRAYNLWVRGVASGRE